MTPECTITVRSPADLIALTPYVLGFHPTDSLVVMGLADHAVVFGVRYDLPPPDDDGRAIAAVVAAQDLETATLIGYGPPGRVTPTVLRLAEALVKAGVRVNDVLRVTDGRWWSYSCDDPGCCPPEGQPCRPPDNPIAAQAVFQGQVALPNRATLVAQVAPLTGPPRVAMSAATGRARARMTDLVGTDLHARRTGRTVRRAGRTAVQEVERRSRSGRPPTDDQLAWLGVLLIDQAVEDYAMDRSDGQQWQIELWTEVVRRVDPAYAAGPACVLGYTAWRAGIGSLARVAVDRALTESPGHRTAGMLDHLLCAGIGPHMVAAMTPPPRVPRPRGDRRQARRRSL